MANVKFQLPNCKCFVICCASAQLRKVWRRIIEIHFEGELSCRPITLEDLAKDNISLSIIYQLRKSVEDPIVQEHLDAVLRMASDQLCNTCYEMNVDPFILDYWQPGVDYIVTPFEPEVLE